MADVIIGAVSAWALAASFPLANLVWLAPLGVAGMVYTWRERSWRSATLLGYLEGVLYFTLVFSWFGETVGAYVGAFGFIVSVGPALAEAAAFAVTAGLVAWVWRRARPWALAPAAALAFALTEYVRTSGTLGVPFGMLAEPFVQTPLRPLAALGGPALVTLAVVWVGAALGQLASDRGRWRPFAVAAVSVLVLVALAWVTWPARTQHAGSFRAAAVQGNIRQDVKWNAATLAVSIERYTSLTRSLAATHPQLVVWPETVITTYLDRDPALQARFASLARELQTTLVVGTDERAGADSFNTLWYFTPQGALQTIYQKRRLVPFAEYLPARGVLGSLPFADLISGFAAGSDPAVVNAGGVATAPLICWESGFADLASEQVRRGAQLFVVATDDAWFGETGGPFQHAQLGELLAVETGLPVVRAAATGISGIIRSDGTIESPTQLDTQAVVTGLVPPPQPTLFSRVGPAAVALALGILLAVTIVAGVRPRREGRGAPVR